MTKRRDIFKIMGAGAGASMVSTKATASLFQGTNIPTLPQYDNLLVSLARNIELAGKRSAYSWTMATPNIHGVPLVFGLPLDELPSIDWLIKVVVAILQLAENFIASLLAQMNAAQAAALAPLQQQIQGISAVVSEVRAKHERLMASNAGKSTVDLFTSTQADLLQQRMQATLAQIPGIWAQLMQQVQRNLASDAGMGAFSSSNGLDRFNALYATIPIPPAAKELYDDHAFAYLRVGGPNPMLLTRVEALPAKFPLTASQYSQVMGGGDSLAAAITTKRIYILDYVKATAMAPAGATVKPLAGTSYNTAPIALFVVPVGESALVPVAIQCGQDPASNPMFLRPSAGKTPAFWSWQMAKKVVQTADLNYHEMFVHLGHTHLVSEAFCVATHRCLAPTHPLNVLLRPHFEGDIWINLLAALIILTPGTFGDLVLGPPIALQQQSAVNARLAFDFYANMPPSDFKSRGIDDIQALPDYPYRDDALLNWNAISKWVSEYISVYYTSDQDVIADRELTAWVSELANSGRIKGFKTITSRAQLTSVIAMVIFTASAQHAAVNFPQKEMMTYAPLFSGYNSSPPPTKTSGATQADWLNQQPGPFVSMVNMYFLSILGSTYYRPLGEYRANRFPYPNTLTDPRVSGPLQRFRSHLAAVEQTIQQRNFQRTRPYTVLLPSKIPSSTNI